MKYTECRYPWETVQVLTDGSVRPCCWCNNSAGNLNDNTFEEIWNGEPKFGRVIHVYGHSMSHYGEYDYCVLFEEEISGSYAWNEVDPLTEEEMCACELLEV